MADAGFRRRNAARFVGPPAFGRGGFTVEIFSSRLPNLSIAPGPALGHAAAMAIAQDSRGKT
jgi:hypothetical protein